MTQSNTIQFAYAFDSQGSLTHISCAERSQIYRCPGCESHLSPVLGEIKAKHFRHFEESCSLETYLHKCAKEAFFYCYQQALTIGIPIKLEIDRIVSCNGERLALVRNRASQCEKSVSALYNLTQFFDQAELEKRCKLSGMQPDIMLSDASGSMCCFVEICVTHPCSQEKMDTGIPIIEFKVQSANDIQMLLSGTYSIKDERLSVYNWLPSPKTVDICSGFCAEGDMEMSVWRLSDSGRLNEQTMILDEVDLEINSVINSWPKPIGTDDLTDNLRNFLLYSDPNTQYPNCIMCKQSSLWKDGYLQCRIKDKQVPYTEARQCASYEVGE
jgi:hypothetical protein